jgi:hypothetical protein
MKCCFLFHRFPRYSLFFGHCPGIAVTSNIRAMAPQWHMRGAVSSFQVDSAVFTGLRSAGA